MYAAKHYIRNSGRMITPGEYLPEDMPEESIEWLLSKGAIQKVNVPKEEVPEEPAEDIAEIDAMAGIVEPKKRRSRKGTA